MTSDTLPEDKFSSKLSPFGDYMFGSGLIFIGLFSVIGNGAMLAVFYNQRGKLTIVERLLVNMGILDILLSTASYPCAMISSFYHRWMFGELGCQIYAFVCYYLGIANILSLTVIAFIRYLKTCKPVVGSQTDTQSCGKILLGIYSYSLFWAVLPLFGISGYDVEPFGLSCTLEWVSSHLWSQIYVIACCTFIMFIPLFIMCFSYYQIVLLVRQSNELISSHGAHKRNLTVSDLQLTKVTFLICCGFGIGWLPYTLACLWGAFVPQYPIPVWMTPIPVFLAKSSITVNPIVYIFLTRRYRQDFVSLWARWRKHSDLDARESSNARRTEHYNMSVLKSEPLLQESTGGNKNRIKNLMCDDESEFEGNHVK